MRIHVALLSLLLPCGACGSTVIGTGGDGGGVCGPTEVSKSSISVCDLSETCQGVTYQVQCEANASGNFDCSCQILGKAGTASTQAGGLSCQFDQPLFFKACGFPAY